MSSDKTLDTTENPERQQIPLKVTQTVQRNPFVKDPDKSPYVNIRTQADLNKEYVSNGYQGYLPFMRALPRQFDDLTQEFGVDVYERMLTDSEVSATVQLLKMACLSRWDVMPSHPVDDPNYNFSLAVAQFVKRTIENLQTPFVSVLNQLLDALAFGSKASEQDYMLCADGVDEGMLILRDIKAKPNRALVYVVDSYMNVRGVLTARYPGQVFPAGTLIALPTGKSGMVEGMLPRSKFVIFTWDMKDNDPRGRSILRPAYQPWWFKQQVFGEFLSWASKFASPSLVGETAPNAQPQIIVDENLEPVLGSDGKPQTITPEEVFSGALTQLRNGSAMAIPNGAKVHPIDTGNDGNAFAEAIRLANSEIVKAVLKQTLATLEGKNQSRAASETHQDILGMVILFVKNSLTETIRKDVFWPLLRYNYGQAVKDFIPYLDLSRGDGFPMTPEQVALLQKAGYLDPSQFDAIDSMLGLPPRKQGPPPSVPAKPAATGAQPAAPQPQPDPNAAQPDTQKALVPMQPQGYTMPQITISPQIIVRPTPIEMHYHAPQSAAPVVHNHMPQAPAPHVDFRPVIQPAQLNQNIVVQPASVPELHYHAPPLPEETISESLMSFVKTEDGGIQSPVAIKKTTKRKA